MKNRWREFEDFVRMNEKKKKFGNLRMEGDYVYSYGMIIAKINRNARLIEIDATKRSHTTTIHQSAVIIGAQHLVDHYNWNPFSFKENLQ
jgi:hypothetical protein